MELYERLKRDYENHDRIIIAYDLDDTVRPYLTQDCSKVMDTIKQAKKILNPYFIVYTANRDKKFNIEWLNDNYMPWDSINSYPDYPYFNKFKTYAPDGKLYYNLLLDDKAGLDEALLALEKLITYATMKKSIYTKDAMPESKENSNYFVFDNKDSDIDIDYSIFDNPIKLEPHYDFILNKPDCFVPKDDYWSKFNNLCCPCDMEYKGDNKNE